MRKCVDGYAQNRHYDTGASSVANDLYLRDKFSFHFDHPLRDQNIANIHAAVVRNYGNPLQLYYQAPLEQRTVVLERDVELVSWSNCTFLLLTLCISAQLQYADMVNPVLEILNQLVGRSLYAMCEETKRYCEALRLDSSRVVLVPNCFVESREQWFCMAPQGESLQPFGDLY
jgi:hypothetical protein